MATESMARGLRNFSLELPSEYRETFDPHFERALKSVQAYTAKLSPSLRKALEGYGPKLSGQPVPGNFKPHSIWIAQFFGITDADVIARAFHASLLMELHCCLQDRRIDRELRHGIDFIISDALSNVLLSDSLAEFAALAGDSAFHQSVRSAFCDLAEAYATEAAGDLPYLSPEKMFKAVVDRAAPFHILIAAMGYHSGQLHRIAPCSAMTCHLVMWFQILDDATDWEVDLARGRRSYLLHRLEPLMEGKPFERWQAFEVADALYLFGGAEDLLNECMDQLKRALEIAEAHAAAPALAETPEALARWLRIFAGIHGEARQWSIARKREFLGSHALPHPRL